MKKSIYLAGTILVTVFLISGCQYEIVKETDNSNQELELLEQKIVCAEYEGKALAQIDQDYSMKGLDGGVTNLEKIFYSPKANSCLYITTFSSWIGAQHCKNFALKDVLTKEEIVSDYSCQEGGATTSTNNKTFSDAYADFTLKVMEYDPDFRGIDNWSL
jgi:hypothetical protein